ncbi:MAG: malonyl-CoA synthase [Pseudomonadota bacterium]
MTNILYDALLAKGRSAPEQLFAETDDGRIFSYADVDDIAARFAVRLIGCGVQPGDRVAVQVEKSIEALILYLATVRAGAVFLPLNTAYTPTEVTYFIKDAEPALLICRPESHTKLAPIAGLAGSKIETMGVWSPQDVDQGSFFVGVPDPGVAFETIRREQEDLAAILYTSGTTGRSKGAMLSHRNLLSNAEVLVDYWQFSADDILLHALPIFHTHGLFVATNTILMAGGKLLFQRKFDVDQVIGALPGATAMMGVPTFYTRLLDSPRFTREVAASTRLFVSGSAPLLAETHKAFQERTGHRILERYGMTETNMNTSNPYDGERRGGTVGFPLPGIDVKVTDPERGTPVSDGDVGMIEVRGPNVFQGYWRMPEKTAEELREDGFFITGDLGLIDDRGYVQIVGRSKDLIISGGYNIYPKEIELVLDEQPGVLESAVIGVPHPDFGESPVGILVAETGKTPDLTAIEAAMGSSLARFKQPKALVVIEELPRNAMGKVQKNQLRDTYLDLFSG